MTRFPYTTVGYGAPPQPKDPIEIQLDMVLSDHSPTVVRMNGATRLQATVEAAQCGCNTHAAGEI